MNDKEKQIQNYFLNIERLYAKIYSFLEEEINNAVKPQKIILEMDEEDFSAYKINALYLNILDRMIKIKPVTISNILSGANIAEIISGPTKARLSCKTGEDWKILHVDYPPYKCNIDFTADSFKEIINDMLK